MNCEALSMADFGLAAAAAVLTEGFSDYFVKIPFTAAALLRSATSDGVDLAESRIVLLDGKPAGGLLIARRGWTSRLAGMALVPSARRQGVGRWAMERVMAEARARGEQSMVLEVIEQNPPAVRLYEACGFGQVRKLVGFERPAGAASAGGPALTEVDIRFVASLVSEGDIPNLPWQLSGETIAHLTPPHRAYGRDGAWAVISDPAAPEVAIRGIAVSRGAIARQEARVSGLLGGLVAAHPGRRWRIKALWPEELGNVFAAAGFARTELTQWQMQRPLQ